MIDEGYIKFDSRWKKSAPLRLAEIELLVEWRRPLYAAGLIGQYRDLGIGYGNMSARVQATDTFVITGTQTGHLPELTARDFALVSAVDIAQNICHSEGYREASSESLTHAAIYALDPEIRAVVHVHSRKLWLRWMNAVATSSADVSYGTPSMAAEFGRLYADTDFRQRGIAVMAGHDEGLVATGTSVREATERILSLDTIIG